jgi:hypothetical protein
MAWLPLQMAAPPQFLQPLQSSLGLGMPPTAHFAYAPPSSVAVEDFFENALATADACGDVASVVALMGTHRQLRRVQERGCAALCRTAWGGAGGDEGGWGLVVSVGGVEAGVGALAAHGCADEAVALEACRLLTALCRGSAAAVAAGAAGGVEATAAALAAHAASGAVAEEACALLAALTGDALGADVAAWHRERGGNAGAPSALAAALAAHGCAHGTPLLERACGALVALVAGGAGGVGGAAAAAAATHAGAAQALSAALVQRSEPEALRGACAAVGALANADASAAHACADVGAVAATAAVLRDYPRFPEVQAMACYALNCMLTRPDRRNDHAPAALSEGACAAARAALRRHCAHGLEEELGSEGAALLELLQPYEDADAQRNRDALSAGPAAAAALESLFPWMRVSDDAGGAAGASGAAGAQLQSPLPLPLPTPLPPPPPPPPPPPAPPKAVKLPEERPSCVICLDELPCLVLLPCKHIPVCASAACAAMMGTPPLCPMCRVPVADTLAVFPL